ncbi:acetyl/propionyl/methylcrotonyl-CoA carboxylase subunit alpha [Asticcacaulis benevestitus]|uniref:3-methylcrotonyl-CoA carboxylase subunit alpha n=1 Tax=Asticcacaulis benevestitus DSM 16100 = ATCC BAA-896 TaxID=1121022 RepID=V4P8M7_9CAUL|nr:acetyl/propionyl/methylcrotonyl-CoA carboxylase subunit alpha [Asticcacaulis benevestitus]ESQ90272.1 3-methylcrotonyl-CoA carboxylase subunit alpha [Asticcacaulis benevestitus DSM 16100 = ATCC BAA-896]
MFKKILIANRGEIARRIIRTCKRMNIQTVAVYSEADARAAFVREADRAVLIGPPAASDSYLRGDRIIAVALETGTEAIHPGYGFLSENADFAEACEAAGLAFIGPRPDAIRAMALKGAAKALMTAAGVPVTPGYHGDDQNTDHLAAEAARIGYPVLIKAVAGGGGKGLRRVDDPAEFADALLSAQREGQAAFGDPKVLIEKYLEVPRHIEIQLFADDHGNVVHLFERDCSLQRRHQKVIEEAPAPNLPDAMRQAMGQAAVRAAQAIRYRGAGTVEFIVDVSNGIEGAPFYFMEMNTRLQVEHPVTEAITGLDLVEWQLRVAAGEPLPKTQGDLTITGHAIEARLYAEDPQNDFLPATGTLERLEYPPSARIESAVEQGDEVSVFYDPMIAKIIVHGKNRKQALSRMREALIETKLRGLATNLGFLRRVVSDEAFAAAEIDTGFIARHQERLLAPWADREMAPSPADPTSPWNDITGWMLNLPPRAPLNLKAEAGEKMIASGDIKAPMPGKLLDVFVTAGETVEKGQKLLILGAMKIEHTMKAPKAGLVTAVHAATGDQVADKALLVEIE